MFDKIKKYYSENHKVFHYLVLILIILLGGFLRLYNLDTNPVALNQDEAMNGYDAYAIANTGRDQHGAWQPEPMLQSFGDWTSPLITYITVPFVKVFGLSVWSTRLPTAILGILSILLFYLLVLQLLKKQNYALIGAFIWAFSPWAISSSRWAIPPSIVPFFLLLFLNLFFWALNSKQFTWSAVTKFVLAGFSAGLLAYAYPTMKLFVPIFVGVICLIYLRKKFRQLFITGFICLLTIAPIFYLTFVDPAKYNSRYGATSLAASGDNLILGFITRYLEYLSPIFSFGFGDPNPMQKVPGFSSIPDFLAIFFYIGVFIVLYKLIKKKESYLIEKSRMFVLLAGLFIFPIADALTKDHLMLLRSIHGFIFITIFTLIGIRFVMEQIPHLKVRRLIIGVGTFLIIFNTLAFSFFYFAYYPSTVKSQFNYGLKETFDYVEQNKNSYGTVYVDKDILQIYYLFFTKYDANKLHPKPEEDKFNVYDNGKVVFKSMCNCDLRGGVPLYTVEDDKELWYAVYSNNGNLYVVRELRNK